MNIQLTKQLSFAILMLTISVAAIGSNYDPGPVPAYSLLKVNPDFIPSSIRASHDIDMSISNFMRQKLDKPVSKSKLNSWRNVCLYAAKKGIVLPYQVDSYCSGFISR